MYGTATIKNKQGFTLIEVLISITLIAFLAFLAVSVAGSTFNKAQLGNETDHLINTLRLAQSRSISGYQDGEWGVYMDSTSYTLYRGTDYASRDASYDRVREYPEGLSLSGISEVHFSFGTGETSNTGTIVISESASSDTRMITVNENGRVTNL